MTPTGWGVAGLHITDFSDWGDLLPMAEAARLRGPDILLRTGPSLSATVEEPVAPPPQPPASASNDPVDQKAGANSEMSPQEQAAGKRTIDSDSKTANDNAGQDEGGEQAAADADGQPEGKRAKNREPHPDDAPVDPNLPSYAKREITIARNQKREAEKKAAEALALQQEMQGRLKQLQEQMESLQAKAANSNANNDNQAAPEQPATDARPTRDQFDDPDAYDQALASWAEREGERKAAAKVEAEKAAAEKAAKEAQDAAQRAAAEAEVAKLNEQWTAKVEAAKAKYDDYEAVAMSEDVPISPVMATALIRMENGPDVAYYLGSNVEEAQRIASLADPMMQAMEIGRLSERLNRPPVRRAPRAQPLDPVDGGFSPADTSEREETIEEVAERHRRRYAEMRRPSAQVSERRH